MTICKEVVQDAEATLEGEEAKVLQAQVENQQLQQQMAKKLGERDEEIEELK